MAAVCLILVKISHLEVRKTVIHVNFIFHPIFMKLSLKCLFSFALSEYDNKNLAFGPNIKGSVGKLETRLFFRPKIALFIPFSQQSWQKIFESGQRKTYIMCVQQKVESSLSHIRVASDSKLLHAHIKVWSDCRLCGYAGWSEFSLFLCTIL